MKIGLIRRTMIVVAITLLLAGINIVSGTADIYDDIGLILYEQPSDNAAPYASYYPGSPIEILEYKSAYGDDAYWVHVRIGAGDGRAEGWVYNRELQQFYTYPSALPAAYVDASKLDLTSDRSPSFSPIDSYGKGTPIKILGRGIAGCEGWDHVLVDGKIGFMNAAYLIHDLARTVNKVTHNFIVGDSALVNATETYANLRAMPNDEADLVGTLYNGVEVRVAESRFDLDGWVNVSIGEPSSGFTDGYMRIEDLAFGKEKPSVVSTVPTETASRALAVHLVPDLAVTGEAFLYWLSPDDKYDILGIWNARLTIAPIYMNHFDRVLFISYTTHDGNVITGFIIP